MNRSGFSKEDVYTRLLKNASELWHIHESELDSMDPLAKMLLGATAKEIERIGNELYSSDARIFRRLSQFLLPDELQTASPAHGVLQLKPNETIEVTRYDEFTYEKQWKNKKNLNRVERLDINFSCAGEFMVNNAILQFRAQKNTLYEVKGNRVESISELHTQIHPSEVYLGFKVTKKQPYEFRLYFDWLSRTQKKALYEKIGKVRFYDMEGTPLTTNPGLKEASTSFNLKDSIKITTKLEEKIHNYYNERFTRFDLGDEAIVEAPEFIKEALTDGGISDAERIIWVKLVFPPDLNPEATEEVVILDNCIPVLNRKLEKSIYRLHKELNIKKLDFKNYYLEVEMAESSDGKRYGECPSLDITEMSKGSYSVRLGGTGRLDERDGYEYLNYLLDLLRDEKQSFAAMDVSSTISDLRTIEQVLTRVKKRLDDAEGGSKQPYIIIKPFTDSENAHLYFWSTDAEYADGIPINSRLRCSNSGLASDGYSLLVAPTKGGKSEKDSKEMIQTYRSALLSRGMVVTKKDIVELCKAVAGNQVEKVEIQNGVMVSDERGQGLKPTLDVHLKFSVTVKEDKTKEHVRQLIQSEILSNSNFAKPIRVLTA